MHVVPSGPATATSQADTSDLASLRRVAPGVGLALLAALLAFAAGWLITGVSPLLVAIVLGILLANTTGVPAWARPGIEVSAKRLLRAGIVLLGLQLVLGDILALGAPVLLVVLAVVAGGLATAVWAGRLLRVPPTLALLIGCGFSICGAAAVAAAAGVTEDDEDTAEHAATAIALVVIFGTLMIPLVPLCAAALDLAPATAGLWAGASVHEVAQVVAAGGIIGGGALTVAVLVKLARVLLLAPVIAGIGLHRRRALEQTGRSGPTGTTLPPVVPPFVLGFLAMVALRSTLDLPDAALDLAATAQTALLAAAMFALGCGVRAADLRKGGLAPFALAAITTAVVAGIALTGVTLAVRS